jgi:hypothetical protein
MLIESIGGYAKQLPEIQARVIITKKIQRVWGRTRGRTHRSLHGGGGATVDLQRRGDLLEQCADKGEDRRRC